MEASVSQLRPITSAVFSWSSRQVLKQMVIQDCERRRQGPYTVALEVQTYQDEVR